VHLRPSIQRDDAEVDHLNLAKMDEDPFIYFLTPTPSTYADDDGMDFDMDFDAGIEDAKRPAQIVRSISPSSLGGLGLPPPRPPTPPRSPSTPELEYDLSATPDDHEQYDYLDSSWPPRPASHLSIPRRLKDKFRPSYGSNTASLAPPPPSSPPPRTSSRGRAVSRPGPSPIVASSSGGGSNSSNSSRKRRARLSPHAWREPSPDVYAIEEEPEQEQQQEEEDFHSEMGGSYGSFMSGDGIMSSGKSKAVDIPAAKPKKRVRFVLPGVDDVWGTY
jgi:hypothetical protein